MSADAFRLPADTDPTVEPTTHYWQEIVPAGDPRIAAPPPYRLGYPARLTDGSALMLPLRPLPDGERAAASLIANHASFEVIDVLSGFMADLARPAAPEVIVGMPTLGLVFAPQVARLLGHRHYVPLGYSKKFWYSEALSEPTHSITTPGAGKRVYLDPNLLPRLEGRRVVLVDDAVSSGSTMISALALLKKIGCEPAAIVVAMRQGGLWRETLGSIDPALPQHTFGAYDAPLFRRGPDGWWPVGED